MYPYGDIMLFFYDNKFTNSGIYEIRNRVTNRSYIGQSCKLKNRWQDHKQTLTNGRKTNSFLLADYKKCKDMLGNDDFLEYHIIDVLEGASKEERLSREEYWIKEAILAYGKNNVYNFNCNPTIEKNFSSPKGPRKGSTQYKKGSDHPYYGKESPMKGKTHTEETRKKIGDSSRNRVMSDDAKEKLRKANIGKKASDQTKEKIRKTHIGKKQSAKTIEKRRQKMLGEKHPGWITGIDKDWLYEQYIFLKKSTHDIAKILSVDVSTICDRLRKYNIPIRNASESRMGKRRIFDITSEELTLLVCKIPVSQIGKLYGVSAKTVERRCRQYNIPTPSRGYWRKSSFNL